MTRPASTTRVLLVTQDEYDLLKRALLNLRTSNADYIKAQKNRGSELRDQAERRVTMIDELLEKLVVREGR